MGVCRRGTGIFWTIVVILTDLVACGFDGCPRARLALFMCRSHRHHRVKGTITSGRKAAAMAQGIKKVSERKATGVSGNLETVRNL